MAHIQLADNDYLAGSQLSIADLYLAVAIHWQMILKEPLTVKYPNVARYLQRLLDQPVIGEVCCGCKSNIKPAVETTPCPQTIINYVKRLSIARIQNADHLIMPRVTGNGAISSNGTIWMIDTSIASGAGKILCVLARGRPSPS